MPKYHPTRGGHAPGHVREAFQDAIDGDGTLAEYVVIDDTPRPLTWLVGQLWNCTDIVPSATCWSLDMPQGSTYAQAARVVKARLGQHRS